MVLRTVQSEKRESQGERRVKTEQHQITGPIEDADNKHSIDLGWNGDFKLIKYIKRKKQNRLELVDLLDELDWNIILPKEANGN